MLREEYAKIAQVRGTLGDSIHALLSAAAMHFRKLLGFPWPILFDRLNPFRSDDTQPFAV